jgi:hypothetical protein
VSGVRSPVGGVGGDDCTMHQACQLGVEVVHGARAIASANVSWYLAVARVYHGSALCPGSPGLQV